MTPVEELLAAVTRLRETAAKATPGPWHIRPGNDVSANVARNDDLIIDGGGYASEAKVTVYGAALNADAAWIALANPVLAEPLAAWLEYVADRLADYDEEMHGCQCTVVDGFHKALLVARTINRTVS